MEGIYNILKLIGIVLSILYTIWCFYHDPRVKAFIDSKKQGWKGSKSSISLKIPILPFPFHFHRETINIVFGGLLLNFLGYAINVSLDKSVLYLDMTGTALVAFLLGPWWGAITGLLSNGLIHNLLYPGPGKPEEVIFPWLLVNVAGGLYWGWLGGRKHFQNYLRSPKVGPIGQLWYLIVFGVIGAAVMSLPGAWIQAAMPPAQMQSIGEAPILVRAVEEFLVTIDDVKASLLELGIGGKLGQNLAHGIHNWLKTWFRYIPDKTMSVALAVILLRYAFPLYEKILVHTKQNYRRGLDNWTGPTILGIFYIPCLFIFLLNPVYQFARYWILWIYPFAFAIWGGVALWRSGPSSEEVNAALEKRVESYGLLTELEGLPFYTFYKRLVVGTMVASLFFVAGLPFLNVNFADFLRLAFNFQCVVLGFLLALHLARLAICQNLALLPKNVMEKIASHDEIPNNKIVQGDISHIQKEPPSDLSN